MKHMPFVILLTSLVLAPLAGVAVTAFDPLFQIVSVEGECMVLPAGEKEFVAAEPGRAYAYGTTIKTGRKSTILIRLSEGNECRVMANATLIMKEDVKDAKLKTIELKDGEVDLSLDEKFGESNGLSVETATAICGAIGCDFSVRSSADEDLRAVVILCKKGQIKVGGKDFDIPLLESEDGVSVVGTEDNSFLKVRNVLGDFNIHIVDANGNQKIIEAKKDSEIKIWRKLSQDRKTIVITILVTGPDGSLGEAVTRVVDREGAPGDLPPGPGPGPEPTDTTDTTGDGDDTLTETPESTVPPTTTSTPPEEADAVTDVTGEGQTTEPTQSTTQPTVVVRGGGDEDEDDGGDGHNPTPRGSP